MALARNARIPRACQTGQQELTCAEKMRAPSPCSGRSGKALRHIAKSLTPTSSQETVPGAPGAGGFVFPSDAPGKSK